MQSPELGTTPKHTVEIARQESSEYLAGALQLSPLQQSSRHRWKSRELVGAGCKHFNRDVARHPVAGACQPLENLTGPPVTVGRSLGVLAVGFLED